MKIAHILSAMVLATVLTLSLSAQVAYVNSTADPGVGACDATECTLREAITYANATSAITHIWFAIPGSGPHTIQPTSPLPAITNEVIIDGLKQEGADCFSWPPTLKIEIDGQNASALQGLLITGDNVTVRGLVINRFDEDGIHITSNTNTIQCNFIGTNVAGTSALPNGDDGVDIGDGGMGNTIGGDAVVGRNLISGNTSNGVEIEGAFTQLNVVVGNLIGTDVTGTLAVPNATGIKLKNANDNTIRMRSTMDRQVISGNTLYGIAIYAADDGRLDSATDNKIWGNFIGTDITGSTALPNEYGVLVLGSENTIGHTSDGYGNVISGNSDTGIVLYATGSSNEVYQNLIGTNADGTAAIPNGYEGISIAGSDGNIIGGGTTGEPNVISGNGRNGILIANEDVPIPEKRSSQPSQTFRGLGINVLETPDNNTITGNRIGTNAAGAAALPNGTLQPFGDGIEISGGDGTYIGGTAPSERNVISGNVKEGIFIIGTDVTNVTIQGNYIGTNSAGTSAIPNGDDGIDIRETVGHLVGGSTAGEGNVISGNTGDGIEIAGWNEVNPCDTATPGDSPYGNTAVLGNHIGTNANGTAAIPNGGDGIEIDYTDNNTIGDVEPPPPDAADKTTSDSAIGTASNIIAGNGVDGVMITCKSYQNVVQRNLIGTAKTGTTALGNSLYGVQIDQSASNTIGGFTQAMGNVISGSSSHGILIEGPASVDNLVSGNKIGTDLAGTGDLGNNGDGVRAQHSGPQDIGGFWPNQQNTIAFNSGNGISIIADPAPSALKGIHANSMFLNGGLGIDLGNDGITANDAGDGDLGANQLQNFPIIVEAELELGAIRIVYNIPSEPSPPAATGSAYPISVEFFRASVDGEGEAYLGMDTYTATDYANGPNKEITLSSPSSPVVPSDKVVATATDANNNTSEFTDVPKGLPVELLSLNATIEEEHIRLHWATASENNNAGFEIERATDLQPDGFLSIGYVEGFGSTTDGQSYIFDDMEPVPYEASRLLYRLKQIDFDGSSSYSPTVAIDRAIPSSLELHANYPNPFNPGTTIRFALPADGHVQLTVYDALGRTVKVLIDDQVTAGRHKARFDAAGLPSGVYIYRLLNGQEAQTGRMLLVR